MEPIPPMRLLTLFAIAAFPVSGFLPGSASDPARAEGGLHGVIVLDGSGSMGGPLEGQTDVKFDMARDAVRQAVTNAPPSAPLGLVVAGHRRKGNCSDIELVTPPAPGSAAQMMARLDRIGTVGKGPLVQALREAAKTIPAGTAGSLILVHDGEDNCRQDPCAAAGAIAKANPQIAIHVVTVSLDPQVASSMACLAKATGGKQFAAKNAAALQASLNEAFMLAGLTSAPAAQPKPVAEAAPADEPEAGRTEGPPRVRLTAALGEKGAALAQPVVWRVTPAGQDGKPVIETTAAELAAPLPAGRYVAEARAGLASARQEFDVAEKGETTARIALGAGILKVAATANKSGEALSMPILTLFAKAAAGGAVSREPIWIGRRTTAELLLPAGSYVMRVADGLAIKEAPFDLAAGSEAVTDFVMGTGRLEVAAATNEGGSPLEGAVFTVSTDDPDAPQGRREIARSASPRPDFVLAAGTYYISATLGPVEVRERIAIGTGDVVKRTLVLGAGQLALSATYDAAHAGPGAALTYRIYTTGEGAREIARSSAPAPELYLPIGRYRVEAQIGSPPLSAVADAEVALGQQTKAVLAFETAQITIRSPAVSGKGPVRWELADARGRVILRSSQDNAKSSHLSPGRYVMRSDHDGRQREAAIDLKAGDVRTIDAE